MDCPSEDTIAAFIEGSLAVEDAAGLLEHIDRCRACREVVAGLARAGEASTAPTGKVSPPHADLGAIAEKGNLPIGSTVGRYRVVRFLGKGGMSVVYEVFDPVIRSRAALKTLLPRFAPEPAFANRILKEARAANQVGHPSFITIFELGALPDGAPYIVMEYLDGESLLERYRRWGTERWRELLPFLGQVAAAMAVAHTRGVVHRDLKPDNVMLIRNPLRAGKEEIKILDLGLAKLVSETSDPSLLATAAGEALGTPLYMAPEQFDDAGRVGPKADVFSLGVVLYQFVVGRMPWKTWRMGQVVAMKVPDAPHEWEAALSPVPERLASLVRRMLARSPEERPEMSEVAAELTGEVAVARAGPTVKPASGMPAASVEPGRKAARKWGRAMAGVALLALIAAAWQLRPRPTTALPGARVIAIAAPVHITNREISHESCAQAPRIVAPASPAEPLARRGPPARIATPKRRTSQRPPVLTDKDRTWKPSWRR